ncbi:MAG: hypothetical protein WAV05_04605 [Anaerolineales bacterium]
MYIISPLVVVHFLLTVKGNIFHLQGNLAQPLIYGALVLILLILRINKIKIALIGLRHRINLTQKSIRLHTSAQK